MAKTTAEILAETKALLSNFKPGAVKRAAAEYNGEEYRRNDIRYPWTTKHFLVLAPVGYEWKRVTVDVYEGEVYTDDLKFATIVLHGHPVGKMCFAPDKCHVSTYKPIGNESEVFLRHWKEKWG